MSSMIRKSKIIFFCVTLLIIISLISCKKSKYDVIPDVYVDFYLSLSDPEFFVLTGATNSMVITSTTNNFGSSAAGYNNNGIIVYRSALEDQFYAYDRTCPYDYAVNGLSIKINTAFMSALCPKCSTSYSLEAGGTPISGIGRYPLKNYKTGFDGQNVHVWHH
jgi:nitrite reductase/ring-hydroxylating ferredoxin subunit